MSRIYISPEDRKKHDERAIEWGERGPAHNIHYTVSVEDRDVITLGGAANNVAATSAQRQKQRTFTE